MTNLLCVVETYFLDVSAVIDGPVEAGVAGRGRVLPRSCQGRVSVGRCAYVLRGFAAVAWFCVPTACNIPYSTVISRRDLSWFLLCVLSLGSAGDGSGRLLARGHGENPGYARFCGVPDIPSNPHHTPVRPVDGPNTTNARLSCAFMVCVCYGCFVRVATTPPAPSRHYHFFPPWKKVPIYTCDGNYDTG